MQITKRDIEIINFINEFGFCEMPHIERKFGIKKPRCYQIMQRLVRAGLVIHKPIFRRRYGVYCASKIGAEFSELLPLTTIPIGIYEHQLIIIDVYFKLMQQHPDAEWVGERRLKQEKFMGGMKKRGHVADGMLTFPDDKQIAIEVELTMKGKLRLESILKGYAGQFAIKEVWYYCSPEVFPRLSKIVAEKSLSFIKVHTLDHVIPTSKCVETAII